MTTTMPVDWPYHGRSSGYRYGCRCPECKAFHVRELANCKKRALHGDLRQCKRCEMEYDRRQDSDAGTKYCGACRRAGVAYSPMALVGSPVKAITNACPLCDVQHTRNNRWFICHDCEQRLPSHIWRSLKTHHADFIWVMRAVNNSTCQICDTDLLALRKTANGNYKSSFCIDHDHTCCAKEASCGSCIRGFLCHACNAGIGYLKDDPKTIARALSYVESIK